MSYVLDLQGMAAVAEPGQANTVPDPWSTVSLSICIFSEFSLFLCTP